METVLLIDGPMVGRRFDALTTGQRVWVYYRETGAITVTDVQRDTALLLEEGRRYFNGLYTARAWAPATVWAVRKTDDGRWQVLRQVEVRRGHGRSKVLRDLRAEFIDTTTHT